VTGVIALHGGGEFLPGDEPFLRAVVTAASHGTGAIRIAVVPTAAARGRPDLAGEHGVRALERVAHGLGATIEAEVVSVLDARSAADPALATELAGADMIHLPGGDPDLIPAVYPGSEAWTAIRAAHEGGAVIAGASAGAMALAAVTWTPYGIVAGLGLVRGLLVVPHADAGVWGRIVERYRDLRPVGLGVLGLAERTGIIGRPGSPWEVAGEGEVHWLPPGVDDAGAAIVVSSPGTIVLE
jgi:cyanophycinase